MKWWQLFLLMASICLANHTPDWIAIGTGYVMAVFGFIAMWRDE